MSGVCRVRGDTVDRIDAPTPDVVLNILDLSIYPMFGATVRVAICLENSGAGELSPGLVQIEGLQRTAGRGGPAGARPLFRLSALNAWPLKPNETVWVETVAPHHSTATAPVMYRVVAYQELPSIPHPIDAVFEHQITTRRISAQES